MIDIKHSLPIETKLKAQNEYTITSAIGQGGFGITYIATADVKVGNITATARFAIKEFFLSEKCKRADDGITLVPLDDSFAEEIKSSLKDFITEGERINKLCQADEHIVNVNEVFTANNTAYFVMEYIGGGNLVDLVSRKGKLSEKEAKSIIIPIAKAIGKMHEERVLHLDIKPENIMMREQADGTLFPVIIDFGISMHFNKQGRATTRSKNAAVSVGYSPAEQYGHITSFAPEVDVYALGACVFYMLVGNDPQQAFDVTPEYLERNLGEVDETVKAAVMHAMSKEKTMRTSSVEKFIEELTSTKSEVKPKVITVKVERGSQPSDNTNIKKYGLIAAAVLLCLILVFAFGGGNTDSSQPEPDAKTEATNTQVEESDTIEEAQLMIDVVGQTFKDAANRDFSYTGEVVDGKPNGKGTGIYSYGTYVGEYKDGLRHGADGTFESKDGDNKFRGSFENDKYKEGRLTLTSDGSYFEGSFKDGQPYTGKWYDKDGKFDYEIVNGVDK